MYSTLLAAAARATANTARSTGAGSSFEPVAHLPAQTDVMTWCQQMGVGTALLLIVIGVVYLLYGWSWYKALITLNSALIGGYVGTMIGQQQGGYMLAGGFLGALVCGSAAWPLMKWAVALIGGICGLVVGAAAWRMAGLDPAFDWAGGMTGLVGFGLFAFILFRGSIIMYTSLQGAVMVMIGLLGLAFKHPDFAPAVLKNISAQPLIFPIAVLIPAILGLIFQQNYSPAAPAGAGGGGGDKKK